MDMAQARTDRYTRTAIALHWGIAALILINLALGLFHESLLDGIKWVIPIHKAIGITVLALTLFRIVWRLTHPAPPLPAEMPRWERWAAHVVHFLIYFYILGLTLTGWMLSSGSRKHPIEWFGLFEVPYLPVSKETGHWAHGAHGILGWILLALLVVHVAAALFHQFAQKDGVLHRMLPWVRPAA